MDSKVYLKKDKTCYVDFEKKIIESELSKDEVNVWPLKLLLYLIEHKEKQCSYREIYEYAFEMVGADELAEVEPVTNARKKLTSELKKHNLSVGCKAKNIKENDITIINDKGKCTYQLFLRVDYSQEDENVSNQKKLAEHYYEKYSLFGEDEIDSREKININRILLEVFYKPRFEDDEKLDLSKYDRFELCAPNGFGKTTLMRAVLLAANPSSKIDANNELRKKINDLKSTFGIEERYLTIVINLHNLNSQNPHSKTSNLYEWLLYAAELERVFSVEEFEQCINYFNDKKQFLLLIDGLDEVLKVREYDMDRDNLLMVVRELTSRSGFCSNAKTIIATRPLLYYRKDDAKKIYIRALNPNDDRVLIEKIVENYVPDEKEKVLNYLDDMFLKNMVVTPNFIISLIRMILLNYYENKKSTFLVIDDVIGNTLVRFKEKHKSGYAGKEYDLIYENFAYVALFNYIENKPDDFAKFQSLIWNEAKKNGSNRFSIDDIADAYEHFSLFDTRSKKMQFMAPEVLGPYYLAYYMYHFCLANIDNQEKVQEKFETIFNQYESKEYLYNMLVFFYGILEVNYDPDSLPHCVWRDYIVNRWNYTKENPEERGILMEKLRYLLNSDFVKKSYFNQLLSWTDDLMNDENEKKLKLILETLEE